MIKSTKMLKRLGATFLVVLMSIESFAAVVGDNDGAAFITKAEFDSMKNDFQSQLDRYNSSLDNKIDGAISAYLSGINISKKKLYSLDAACGYTFPLTAYYGMNKELWNDVTSDYYRLSVPKMIERDVKTMVSRWTSNTMIDNDADYFIVATTSMAFAVPPNHRGTGDGYMAIRAGWHDKTRQYDGNMGYLYRIDKSTKTRNINGAQHTVWRLRDRLYGQDNLYYVKASYGAPWDGTMNGTMLWLDYVFLGYTRHPWSGYPYNGRWVSSQPREFDTWTEAAMKAATYHQYCSGVKQDTGSWKRSQWSSLSDAEAPLGTILNDVTVTPTMGSSNWNDQPWTRVVNIRLAGENTMIFAGDANLPAYNDDGFSFAPVDRTTPENTKVAYSENYFNFKDKEAFWNFNAVTHRMGNYNNFVFFSMPFWRATEKDSFQQDSSNSFSMIRASLVSYMDSNKKEHFMDEGMFLGTFEEDCDVEFKLKFESSETNQINLGVSKRPWDINHQAANIPAWSFKIGSSETNVAAGSGMAIVPTNTVVSVKVPSLYKGEELYMIWNPPGTEYVELTQFSDYYITTSG